jgi:hypothetical protein
VRKAGSLDQAAQWLRAADFEPRKQAIVEVGEGVGTTLAAGGDAAGNQTTDGSAASVTVIQYSPRRIVLEVDAAAAGFLVASETHYPGWKASLDGVPAELFFTNVAFRGMAVPAGRHEVVMEFAPAILWRAAALSLIAWLAWVAVLGKRRWRRGNA